MSIAKFKRLHDGVGLLASSEKNDNTQAPPMKANDKMCELCGAAVMDEVLHKRFHEELARTEFEARRIF